MARRREFFQPFEGHYQALWWVPVGHRPTVDEGLARLWKLDHFGPSCDAFTFKSRFLPPNQLGAPVAMKPDPGAWVARSAPFSKFVGDPSVFTCTGLGRLQWESTANQTRTMSNPIRILVVDDHPILRQGLSALLANEPDMLLTGEASNGLEAIELFRSLRPDIMLLDVQMPELGGIEALEAIRHVFPAARIIILTTYAGDALAQRALAAGAQGYVLKGMLRKELLDTIRAVHRGQKKISADVATQLAHHTTDDDLSDREIDVLKLIATGNSNKRIANQLLITEETVKGHVRSILAKLGASDRTHAVTLGLTRGIFQL
jgi:DNA-binding NarL/FixJ family response regulator